MVRLEKFRVFVRCLPFVSPVGPLASDRHLAHTWAGVWSAWLVFDIWCAASPPLTRTAYSTRPLESDSPWPPPDRLDPPSPGCHRPTVTSGLGRSACTRVNSRLGWPRASRPDPAYDLASIVPSLCKTTRITSSTSRGNYRVSGSHPCRSRTCASLGWRHCATGGTKPRTRQRAPPWMSFRGCWLPQTSPHLEQSSPEAAHLVSLPVRRCG